MDYEEAQRQANELIQRAVPMLTRDLTNGEMPKFEATDLSPVKAETTRVTESRDAANAVLEASRTQFSEGTEAEKKAIAAKGQAEAASIYADQEKAKAEADLYKMFGDIFGMTPDKITGIITQVNLDRPKAEAALSEIQAMQSVTPFDNPFEWFGNQIKLPFKIQAYNTQADQLNIMFGAIDNYIDSANKAATFANKGVPTISAAKAKAEADVKLANAGKDAASADLNLAKQNVSFATQKLSNDVASAEATLRSTQLEVQQKTQIYQAQIHAIQFAENHANRLLNAAKLLETLAKNEDEMAQRRAISKVLENSDRILGKPAGTTNFDVWRAMAAPQRENLIAIGAGSLGANPTMAAINFYSAHPGQAVSPELNQFMNYLREHVEAAKVDPQVQLLDEKQKVDGVNKLVMQYVTNDMEHASKPGSIFYEMSPARFLQAAQMKDDSAVALALKPLTQIEGKNIPTELVATTIASAFKNQNDAAQAIADYYKRNIGLRNSSMNTQAAGVVLPNSYDVKVRLGPLSTAKLDFTKPADTLKWLIIQDRLKASDEWALYGAQP